MVIEPVNARRCLSMPGGATMLTSSTILFRTNIQARAAMYLVPDTGVDIVSK